MQIIDKAVFLELAYNQPRDAILALYAELEKAQAEREAAAKRESSLLDAVAALAGQADRLLTVVEQQAAELEGLRATVLELSTVVNAPKE